VTRNPSEVLICASFTATALNACIVEYNIRKYVQVMLSELIILPSYFPAK